MCLVVVYFLTGGKQAACIFLNCGYFWQKSFDSLIVKEIKSYVLWEGLSNPNFNWGFTILVSHDKQLWAQYRGNKTFPICRAHKVFLFEKRYFYKSLLLEAPQGLLRWGESGRSRPASRLPSSHQYFKDSTFTLLYKQFGFNVRISLNKLFYNRQKNLESHCFIAVTDM